MTQREENGIVTDEELLQCATCFDMGPAPIVNGRLADESNPAHIHDRIVVERRFNGHTQQYSWAIFDGFQDLNSTGNWEVRGRNRDQLKRCRYATVQEAIAHYLRWKESIIAWAKKKIAKAKPGERVILNMPNRMRLKL